MGESDSLLCSFPFLLILHGWVVENWLVQTRNRIDYLHSIKAIHTLLLDIDSFWYSECITGFSHSMESHEAIEDRTAPVSHRTLCDLTTRFQGSNTKEMETMRGEFKWYDNKYRRPVTPLTRELILILRSRTISRNKLYNGRVLMSMAEWFVHSFWCCVSPSSFSTLFIRMI